MSSALFSLLVAIFSALASLLVAIFSWLPSFCVAIFSALPVFVPVVSRAVDRKSTRLNSSHGYISYAVFCLKKKTFTKVADWSSMESFVIAVDNRVGSGIGEGHFTRVKIYSLTSGRRALLPDFNEILRDDRD